MLNEHLTALLKCTVDINMAESSSKSSCVYGLEEVYCLLEAGFFDADAESEKGLDTLVAENVDIEQNTGRYEYLSCGKISKSKMGFS